MFAWTFYIDAFLYSASRSRDINSPLSQNYEQYVLGQNYNLGNELNLGAKYNYSKYVEFKVSWSRYTHPTWSYGTKIDSDSLMMFETSCKF